MSPYKHEKIFQKTLGSFACVFLLLILNLGYSRLQAEDFQSLATSSPNFLFIFADDVGQEVLGSYGGESYRTPNLDTLAEGGMRFTHCYSLPVCSPSRTCLLTGKYPFRTGTDRSEAWGTIPADEKTFGHYLQDAGYRTALIGKWQLNLLKENPQFPLQMGFDEYFVFGWHEGPKFYDPLIYHNGKAKTHQGMFGPDLFCDYTIDFMKRYREQPFMAFYAMTLAHEISNDLNPPAHPGPSGKFESYRELVEYMDVLVGRLMAALDELGLRENTVVMFSTDNGSPSRFITDVEIRPNEKRKVHYIYEPISSIRHGKEVIGGKKQLTDAGTNVPFIVNWPGIVPSGRVMDELIDFSDFLPTFLDLAGGLYPLGATIDGQSFAPLITGRAYRPRDWVFSEWEGMRWARNHRWKLYNDGRFFDMQADPGENQPLIQGEIEAIGASARSRLQAVLNLLEEGAD